MIHTSHQNGPHESRYLSEEAVVWRKDKKTVVEGNPLEHGPPDVIRIFSMRPSAAESKGTKLPSIRTGQKPWEKDLCETVSLRGRSSQQSSQHERPHPTRGMSLFRTGTPERCGMGPQPPSHPVYSPLKWMNEWSKDSKLNLTDGSAEDLYVEGTTQMQSSEKVDGRVEVCLIFQAIQDLLWLTSCLVKGWHPFETAESKEIYRLDNYLNIWSKFHFILCFNMGRSIWFERHVIL